MLSHSGPSKMAARAAIAKRVRLPSARALFVDRSDSGMSREVVYKEIRVAASEACKDPRIPGCVGMRAT